MLYSTVIGGRVDSPIGGGSTQQLFVVKITTIKCVHRGGKLINLHTIDTIFCQNMQVDLSEAAWICQKLYVDLSEAKF